MDLKKHKYHPSKMHPEHNLNEDDHDFFLDFVILFQTEIISFYEYLNGIVNKNNNCYGLEKLNLWTGILD